MNYTRRTFLKTSGGALAGSAITPMGFPGRKPASDTITVGLIGCRSMGFGVLSNALDLPGVVCGGLCDIDENILKERSAGVEEKTGKSPALFSDYRKLLDDNDIDAVIIGTPDHWHCLQTIHALEAGKHVYVEKPMANSVGECELMVKAASRYGGIVQVGQQQRSGTHWQEVVKVVQSGRLGNIRHVKLWCNFNYGKGPARVADEAVPDGVDYDMWLGPAPARPFNRNRFHGSWRFFWGHGGGLITDWGAHLLDVP
ncbi:MAG: Gfo/Idh/MocA family oxidoreductase, partial [Balneolales bacterium]